MKSIVFKIDEHLFKGIHIRAAESGRSVQDYMCCLIKADLTQNMDPDQAIETLLERIADVRETLRLADGHLENSAKQLQEKRVELATETSIELQTYVGVTVESFLRSHPNAALDMMSPDGYICLTPEDGQALLNGGEVSAHPGSPEYAVKVPADMILCQQISSIGPPSADNPNLYKMLINYPEPDECMAPEIGSQGMGMMM